MVFQFTMQLFISLNHPLQKLSVQAGRGVKRKNSSPPPTLPPPSSSTSTSPANIVFVTPSKEKDGRYRCCVCVHEN